jgi:hypothetical protein
VPSLSAISLDGRFSPYQATGHCVLNHIVRFSTAFEQITYLPRRFGQQMSSISLNQFRHGILLTVANPANQIT